MKKVLIADMDEDFRCELAAAINRTRKFNVVGITGDGEEAIELLKAGQADVLIIDLLLPQYDGLSVIESMQVADTRPEILVTTPFISDYITSAVARLGVKKLLRKPCTVKVILRTLRRLR